MLLAEDAPTPFYVVRTVTWNARYALYRREAPGFDGDYSAIFESDAEAYQTVMAANRAAFALRKEGFATIDVLRVTDGDAFLKSDDSVHSGDVAPIGTDTHADAFVFRGAHIWASTEEHARYDVWTLYGTDQGDTWIDYFRTMYDDLLPHSHFP